MHTVRWLSYMVWLLLVAVAWMAYALSGHGARLAQLERDSRTIPLVHDARRGSCVMDRTQADVRGRFVVMSLDQPGFCTVATQDRHPTALLIGIMLDENAVAGQAARVLYPQWAPP